MTLSSSGEAMERTPRMRDLAKKLTQGMHPQYGWNGSQMKAEVLSGISDSAASLSQSSDVRVLHEASETRQVAQTLNVSLNISMTLRLVNML